MKNIFCSNYFIRISLIHSVNVSSCRENVFTRIFSQLSFALIKLHFITYREERWKKKKYSPLWFSIFYSSLLEIYVTQKYYYCLQTIERQREPSRTWQYHKRRQIFSKEKRDERIKKVCFISLLFLWWLWEISSIKYFSLRSRFTTKLKSLLEQGSHETE